MRKSRKTPDKNAFQPVVTLHPTEVAERRVAVIAKLHGTEVLDWPGVKRLMQQHLSPSERVGFAGRCSNKRVSQPNEFEKRLIAVWEATTGVVLLYPQEKMQLDGVPTLRRGQSTHGIIKQHTT